MKLRTCPDRFSTMFTAFGKSEMLAIRLTETIVPARREMTLIIDLQLNNQVSRLGKG